MMNVAQDMDLVTPQLTVKIITLALMTGAIPVKDANMTNTIAMIKTLVLMTLVMNIPDAYILLFL
jgi:hypothetical protein